MKTLIYGMQSSGASLFSYFMGQREDSFVIIDLWDGELAPFIDLKCDVILKCVIATKFSLEDHKKSYCPDMTILFLRNPCHNLVSLKSKPWGAESRNKFKLLEKYFLEKDKFDAIVRYEDLVLRPLEVIRQLDKNGFNVDESFLDFRRNLQDMRRFNHEYFPSYCWNNRRYAHNGKYGTGKLHIRSGDVLKKKYINKKVSKEDKQNVINWCPSVCSFYGVSND
ncbi:MAG: hypothetical protein WC119_02185 [Synergistaceae bacterium]